jgi:hypothetical protein
MQSTYREDASLRVQLNWTNLTTGQTQQSILETPIAIGCNPVRMPDTLAGQAVAKLVLTGGEVAGYHALIQQTEGELQVSSQTGSRILLNTVAVPSSTLAHEDYLRVGAFDIQVLTTFSETASEAETGCDRQVGFLFKRRCGRTDRAGCPDCNSGQRTQDTDYDEYAYYPRYGYYDHGYWGYNYYSHRDRYSYDPTTGNVNFTDADSASFDQEQDVDYEIDMGAS